MSCEMRITFIKTHVGTVIYGISCTYTHREESTTIPEGLELCIVPVNIFREVKQLYCHYIVCEMRITFIETICRYSHIWYQLYVHTQRGEHNYP